MACKVYDSGGHQDFFEMNQKRANDLAFKLNVSINWDN